MIKSRRMRWAGHLARKWRSPYRILVGKPQIKRPLERHMRRLEDNTKIDRREKRGGGMDWIDLAYDREHWRAFVNTVMNLCVP
jgi:hypothetical protein